MSAVAIQQMADRVAALIDEKLGIKGPDLSTKVRKAGRALPRKIRSAARDLADAAERAQNPKLLVQIDHAKVAADYDLCVKHLIPMRRGGRFAAAMMNVGWTVLLGLLMLAAALFFIQMMRGNI